MSALGCNKMEQTGRRHAFSQLSTAHVSAVSMQCAALCSTMLAAVTTLDVYEDEVLEGITFVTASS